MFRLVQFCRQPTGLLRGHPPCNAPDGAGVFEVVYDDHRAISQNIRGTSYIRCSLVQSELDFSPDHHCHCRCSRRWLGRCMKSVRCYPLEASFTSENVLTTLCITAVIASGLVHS